jgi:ABC-type sulfate/molybdate transport systems ATPase subunit
MQRGTTVSGGQQARIGFARVLYQQQAINILDDPYSAVDPDVALDMHRHGFEGRLAGTTRVLVVSARLELLATATLVIRLGPGGDVEAHGPPSEVLHGYAVPDHRDKPQDEDRVLQASSKSTEAEEKAADVAGRALTTAEDRAAGTVAKHIYRTYFSYAVAGRGGLVIFSIVAAYSAGQLARIGVDVWLSAWATASEKAAQGDEEQVDSFWWVAVAALLVLANFLVSFGRALLCVSLSIR